MASCSSLLSEDQFLCAICLEVFNDPVSTPCGHNFCLACISFYWENAAVCQCPICKTTFVRKPDLKVNTFISGLAAQLMSLQVVEASVRISDLHRAKPGCRILCDVCTDSMNEAVKSCLECLTSYCDTHLEPHQRVAGLKRHTLVEPLENLEERICKKHNRLLVMFCKTDDLVLCDLCVKLHHLTHDAVPVERAYRERKDSLGRTEAKVLQMIQNRLQKVSEIKESVKQREEDERDVWVSTVEDLTDLVSDIQESQAEIIRVIEEKQKAAREQADDFIADIESEMEELQMTNTKLRDLMDMEDHLCLLKVSPSQSRLPQTRDWSTMSNVEALMAAQQHEVDFRLDSSTAHPLLVLSGGGKRVSYGTMIQRLPNNPNIFTEHLAVLGERGYNSEFYFQVCVGQKTEWCLGVATESIQRRGVLRRRDCGLWAIWFIPDKFETFDSPNVPVHWGKVETVGVFVDYDGGQVSFYDVATATLIYSFTECVFTERLYPYLNPCDNEYGNNSDPLILLPVGHTV
ncbi:nuclear factor 7, brain-like isoform X2 [Genypterus blacodes]|uniref:nuclear factor 7, brain-like isoform X2 n=1 Tax=Genypterus blacodes TaxID=154954 RepID=UPI003F761FE3